MPIRKDDRKPEQLRTVRVTTDFTRYAEGSILIECGETRVVCTASVEERVPQFLRGTGKGWVTAEYGMLPRSTSTRMTRESSRGKLSGRTQEIQRLIGRALRSVVDLERLGERTVWIDCDVIQADGGTRTASITGAFIALAIALENLRQDGKIEENLVLDEVAAVSVGICDGTVFLDLDYSEDSSAEVDMNIVMTGSGDFVEVQGTAEGAPFSNAQLQMLLGLANNGIRELIQVQQEVLGTKFNGEFKTRRANQIEEGSNSNLQ